MPIPVFEKQKFPKEQNLGGGRPHKPATLKGKGPEAFTGKRFGQGLESADRAYNPPTITSQGPQTKTGQHRFGQMTPEKDRPYNPPAPKRGSAG